MSPKIEGGPGGDQVEEVLRYELVSGVVNVSQERKGTNR